MAFCPVGRPAFARLFIALALLALPAHAADLAVTCVRVIDGDSIVVETTEGLRAQVRLLGMDAPEYNQEYGDAAKAWMRERCQGNQVRLSFEVERWDRYGRNLCHVHLDDGTWLNLELVRAGLAITLTIPPNGLHAAELEAAQDEARAAGAGFWNKGGLTMTPHEWRHKEE